MLQIGSYQITGKVLLAPMAGITDQPFRQLCKDFGAAMTTSECISSDTSLWQSNKSTQRFERQGEKGPFVVQLLGFDAKMFAEAAKRCEQRGVDIIDLNMGCPAKKVCSKAAGSALLKNEALVEQILSQVVAAVSIPVTLKIRTGWSPQLRNGITVAKLAEQCGIKALSVHGRTRECRFNGQAEYDTIAKIKQNLSIPVIANGDITSPQKAAQVLAQTGADAVMVGRGAQGKPWIFNEINHFLATGSEPPTIALETVQQTVLKHLQKIYAFYGEKQGLRMARKHIGWYLQSLNETASTRQQFNRLENSYEQYQEINALFERLLLKEKIAHE